MRVAKETHKFLIGGVCAESAKKMKFFFSPYLTEEYPIWWGDMPMAVYSFLDEYDLSGKTVLPFCTHGGSGLCQTDKNVQNEEKDAKVTDGLAISDSSLDDADGDIDQWLKNNGVAK